MNKYNNAYQQMFTEQELTLLVNLVEDALCAVLIDTIQDTTTDRPKFRLLRDLHSKFDIDQPKAL